MGNQEPQGEAKQVGKRAKESEIPEPSRAIEVPNSDFSELPDSVPCKSEDPAVKKLHGGEASDEGVSEEGPSDEEREHEERSFLKAVVSDTRNRSGKGLLTAPSRWVEAGMIPGFMTAEDAEMLVYEQVKLYEAQQAESEGKTQAGSFRSATCAVGVPRMIREKQAKKAQEEASREAFSDDCSSDAFSRESVAMVSSDGRPDFAESGRDNAAGLLESACLPSNEVSMPTYFALRSDVPRGGTSDLAFSQGVLEGAELESAGEQCADPSAVSTEDFEPFELTVDGVRGRVVVVDGSPAFVPHERAEDKGDVADFTDIVLLQGRATYYLYAKDKMTDAFANWSFMAAEADDASILATLARQESKTYPRPFHDASLKNFPFLFDDARIEHAWQDAQESGAYPDLQETFASNGDRYFFSTDFMAPRHAASLAEWSSVTSRNNL